MRENREEHVAYEESEFCLDFVEKENLKEFLVDLKILYFHVCINICNLQLYFL